MKEVKTINVIDTKAKKIDHDKWSKYLSEKKGGYVTIHSICTEVQNLNENYQKIKEKSEKELNELVSKETSDVNRFRIFITQSRLIGKFNKSKDGKRLTKILNDISDASAHHDDEIKKIRKLSELSGLVSEGQAIVNSLCKGAIEECYEGYHTMISNYKALAQKYSGNKKNKLIDKDFNGVITRIDNEKQAFHNRVASSIKNYGDVMENTFEGPKSRRENYENKVSKVTKKLLSKKHKGYLEDALESINSGRLLHSLLDVNAASGEEELISRLEFLKDMEEIGIITYNENQ